MKTEAILRALLPALLVSGLAFSGCPNLELKKTRRLDTIGTVEPQLVHVQKDLLDVMWDGDSLLIGSPPIGWDYHFAIHSDSWGSQSVVVDGHGEFPVRADYSHHLDPDSTHVLVPYRTDGNRYTEPQSELRSEGVWIYTFGDLQPPLTELRITITMQAVVAGPYYDPPRYQ